MYQDSAACTRQEGGTFWQNKIIIQLSERLRNLTITEKTAKKKSRGKWSYVYKALAAVSPRHNYTDD